MKLLHRLKWFLAGCAGTYVGTALFITAVSNLVGVFHHPENDGYKIADNLAEYFSYISQNAVGRGSPVHLAIPVQMALHQRGYELGPCGVDGRPGDNFTAAVGVFQYTHEMKVTGRADPETLDVLFDEILADDRAAKYMDEKLIRPYRTEDVAAFMDSLGDDFAWYTGFELALRPDLGVYAGIEGAFIDSFRESAPNRLFPGCARIHQHDAYRHTATLIRIANFPTGNAEWAKTFLNLREKVIFNPLPERLMDIFNHWKAAGLAEELEEKGGDMDPVDLMIDAVNTGRLMIYPFPLIPR